MSKGFVSRIRCPHVIFGSIPERLGQSRNVWVNLDPVDVSVPHAQEPELWRSDPATGIVGATISAW